ncbi:MAG: alpha/beta hydrolase [Phycisphaerales bacterium]|nr:alpha/beta hydrolase [Phycisphaerales bacterium]
MLTILITAVMLGSPDTRPTPPTDVASQPGRVLKDVPYAGDQNPRHRLNLFLPGTSDTPVPLVVFIHGGGWQSGHYRSGEAMLRPLVATGRYAGASIGYRLTDEAQWPAQIHDCKAALRFLRANAAQWNIDPDRIAVMGPSAGGHLSAMMGTSAGVESMQGDVGDHDDVSDRVTCVVDLFGPTDLVKMDAQAPPGARLKHDAPRSPESRLLGAPLQTVPERAATANPITYITPDDPPFLIIHGSQDAVVPYPQSVMLDAALDKAKVDTIFITVKDGGHGGRGFDELKPRIRAFLDRHLHGAKVEISDAPVDAPPPAKRQNQRRPTRR